jgi:UDP-N-acetylmuramoyl-tripeptide--D-alanyl-D-alanine ligase
VTPRFTEAEVVRATGGSLVRRGVGAAFEGISTDSRTIAPGSLFVALKGEHFDGHDFLSTPGAGRPDRRRKGAALRSGRWGLVEVDDTLVALGRLARAHRSRFAVPIGAVASSNGKTTTKEMAAAILGRVAGARDGRNLAAGSASADALPPHGVAPLGGPEPGMSKPGGSHGWQP